jgi:phosphoglycerate dehydrogenase-like enzyme
VPALPVIVVEDDPFTRLIPLVLDPNASEERRAAFADFMSTDEPDFRGWCERIRRASQGLYPAEVRMVTSEAEMRANLKDCVALVVESFRVGRDDLAAAPKLKVVQKFGTGLRNIDTTACAAKGFKLLTLRRRANISCAEHAFGLMLMLARKLDELDGLVTVERIKAARGAYHPYQRNHTPGGNYARLGGTRALNGATIGIIGLGEIGREIAVRARAFDMNVLYHQRTRAPDGEERELNARHLPLPALLSESDWIVPQLPTGPGTRDLLGRAELSQIKPGACIVNVANAPIIDREALIEALRSGRLGGVALDVHYSEPVPDDDELLTFDNVILTPRMAGSPRFNGLKDFEQLITGLARELAPESAS